MIKGREGGRLERKKRKEEKERRRWKKVREGEERKKERDIFEITEDLKIKAFNFKFKW